MMVSKKIKTLLSLMLCIIICLSLLPASAFADDIPDFFAETSKENALALLRAYDPDGYYIVNYVLPEEDCIEESLDGEPNAYGLHYVVLSYYSMYSWLKPSEPNVHVIYTGDQTDIFYSTESSNVTIFPTETWTETLPDALRNALFPYVESGSDTHANSYGPYGLIEKFAGYCWAMHNLLALFPYYMQQDLTLDVWDGFFRCDIDKLAYADFRLWILGYLDYAKENDPAVYELFMNNRELLEAYLATRSRFESQLEEYDRCLEKLSERASDEGSLLWYFGPYRSIGGAGTYTFEPDYDAVMEELAKPTYQAVEAEIAERAEQPFNPFMDVVREAFYYDPVLWAIGHEPQITKGTTSITFSPSETCTRAEAVTFLWRAQGCPEPATKDNPFTDVSENDWFYKPVLWAVENGITLGVGEGRFDPGGTCNRAQIVTFLHRAKGAPAPTTAVSPFTDVSESDWYCKPILWAVENGVTQGTGGGTFSPAANCTRGQIVTFLYRAQ